MRILWLTNIPSPYRVDFFNELGKYCELTVCFEKKASSERDKSWKKFNIQNFKAIFLKGIKHGVAEAFCPGVIRYLDKKRYDKIVVTNYSDLTGILAIAFMKLKSIDYIIEGDGAFAGSGKGFKERIKTWLLSKAEMCFSTADEHDKYYKTYGVSKEKIVRYPFSSIKDEDLIDSPVGQQEKIQLREKLGMKNKKIIVSVGQFIYRKGYDVLLNSLTKVDESIDCYIIGGNPPAEYLDLVDSLKLKNVHFVGFMPKNDLAEYYKAADAFVLPTREDIWGLVVNEAMAKGLPVITTDRCVAGLELVKNGETGYIVPVNDSDELSERINRLLTYDDLDKMQRNCLEVIKDYTIEKMAQRHIKVIIGE